MSTSIVIASIAEDRLDDWQEFHAELTGPRRIEWAESQRRRGITREAVFYWSSGSGHAAVYLVEGAEAGAAMDDLDASDAAFDVWLRERFADLHEDLDFPARKSDTRPPPGAWRGWRGLPFRARHP